MSLNFITHKKMNLAQQRYSLTNFYQFVSMCFLQFNYDFVHVILHENFCFCKSDSKVCAKKVVVKHNSFITIQKKKSYFIIAILNPPGKYGMETFVYPN